MEACEAFKAGSLTGVFRCREKCVGEGEFADLVADVAVHDEGQRHFAAFARGEGLLLEAEAVELAKMPGGHRGRHAWHGLADDGLVGEVAHQEARGAQLTRVDLLAAYVLNLSAAVDKK